MKDLNEFHLNNMKDLNQFHLNNMKDLNEFHLNNLKDLNEFHFVSEKKMRNINVKNKTILMKLELKIYIHDLKLNELNELNLSENTN